MMQPLPFVNKQPSLGQETTAKAPAQPPMLNQGMYRSELLRQLGGGASAQEPPVTDAVGAAGHVLRVMADKKRQDNMQNFLLNNVGNGQANWLTTVTAGA